MKRIIFMTALCIITLVGYSQKPKPSKESIKIEVKQESPLVITGEFTAAFILVENKEDAKFKPYWEPVGDGTYTYYYKEYSTAYCGICPGGTVTGPTGRCKSTSGAIYDCTEGM